MTFAGYPAAENKSVSDIAIVGAPCDLGVTGTPGQRSAPWAIRAAGEFDHSEFYDTLTGFDYSAASVSDHGDIEFLIGNMAESHGYIRRGVKKILKRCRKLVVLGGDDSINLPVLTAVAEHHGRPVTVIHFDAHRDFYTPTVPFHKDHGTWVSDLLDDDYAEHFHQIGIRCLGPDAERWKKYAPRVTTYPQMRDDEVLDVVGLITNNDLLSGWPVWLAIDIDAVDPSAAPGTGFPEPGGLSARAIRQYVRLLGGYTVGMSITEVCPPLDHNGRTAQLANRLVLDYIRATASA